MEALGTGAVGVNAYAQSGGDAVQAVAFGGAYALNANSTDSKAVYAQSSSSTAVVGTSTAGGQAGVQGAGDFGVVNDGESVGVKGHATGTSETIIGVGGLASGPSSYGVVGVTDSGTALYWNCFAQPGA